MSYIYELYIYGLYIYIYIHIYMYMYICMNGWAYYTISISQGDRWPKNVKKNRITTNAIESKMPLVIGKSVRSV